MKHIWVRSHVLYRWPERIGTQTNVKYIEKMFKNNRYTILEPAKKGRLIVEVKGYVFVISRSNTTLCVHTVYGKYENYKLKRPHAVDDFEQTALDRWERHQYSHKVRHGK